VVDPRTHHEAESVFPDEGRLDRWHRHEMEHPNMFSGRTISACRSRDKGPIDPA